MSFARATLSGVVATNPEKRFTPNNTGVASFQLQVTPTGANEQPFLVAVTCWRQLADTAANELKQGDQVMLEGRLQVYRTENAGNYTSQYELDASNIYRGGVTLLSSQQANAGQRQPAPQQQSVQAQVPVGATVASAPAAQAAQPSEDFWATEDDIPF